MINEYYLLYDGEKKGPYTHDELMSEELAPDTLVLSPIMTDWQRACKVAEFHTYFISRGIYVPGRANYAGFWWRLLAYIIDYVLLLIGVVLFVSILVFLKDTGVIGSYQHLLEDSVSFSLVNVLCFLVYHILFESIKTQGSIGKIICKLAVVDANGSRITFGQAAGRNFSKLLSSLLCGLGFLSALWDREQRTWHDHIAKAYVVRKKF